MKRSTLEIVIGLVVILALVVGSLAFAGDAEWGGADGNAAGLIDETGYTPWYESALWSPPSGEIESLIFALQAAFGAGISCLIFGYWAGQRKAARKD
ncbi:MAG: energy-coupling factor ABC transporter substrate-binding protein [Methanocorpusculum sp.]|nr:energy-coupling factor ABC transporter substrate-binding protein [Methanocorpusculum sp.]HJJ82295.1 energy-coupling factor ABC transporter substrate-binding protein [Methanocorpusculum sp.]